MKVLVTGGAGFIGSHIVDLLVDEGADVVVLDSIATAAHAGIPEYLNPRAKFIQAALHDERALATAASGVDAVCHQAARVGLGLDFGDAAAYVHDNDAGTAALLASLWRSGFAGRLVVASSMVVYGEGRFRCADHGVVRPGPRLAGDMAEGRFDPLCPTCGDALAPEAVAEDAPVDPRNVYAATKLHTEHLAASFARETDATFCALRYHNVYGPRMPNDTPYAGVASIFRSALEAGRAPRVFEDGQQLRDFVHVEDVARANVMALASSWQGALNVASGAPRTVGDLASELAAAFGSSASQPVVTGDFRLGDVRHVVGATQLAEQAIGFRAAVGFGDGVQRFASDPLRGRLGAPS